MQSKTLICSAGLPFVGAKVGTGLGVQVGTSLGKLASI